MHRLTSLGGLLLVEVVRDDGRDRMDEMLAGGAFRPTVSWFDDHDVSEELFECVRLSVDCVYSGPFGEGTDGDPSMMYRLTVCAPNRARSVTRWGSAV